MREGNQTKNISQMISGRRCDSKTTLKVNPRVVNENHNQMNHLTIHHEWEESFRNLTNKHNTVKVGHSKNQTITDKSNNVQVKPKAKKKKKQTKKPSSKSPQNQRSPPKPQKVLQVVEQNIQKKKYQDQQDKQLQMIREKEQEIRRREIEIKNQLIRLNNMKRPKRKRPNYQIPWGLDQNRLRTYLIQQVVNRNKNIFEQRIHKHHADPKQRREEIGLSFLNNFDENSLYNLKQRLKERHIKEITLEQEVPPHTHAQVEPQRLLEVKRYQEWKRRMIELQNTNIRREAQHRQMKIKENLRNLDNYVRGNRNRSVTEHIAIRRKSRSKSKPKKKDLTLQFTQLNERFKRIKENNVTNNRVVTLEGLINQSNSIVSHRNQDSSTQRLAELDMSFLSEHTPFGSNRGQILVQLGRRALQEADSQPFLHASESAQLIKEIDVVDVSSINNTKSRLKIKKLTEVDAAIRIQRIWRGFKTRQLLTYILEQQLQEQEDLHDDFDYDNLTESQLKELVRLGFLEEIQEEEKSNLKIIQQDLSVQKLNFDESNLLDQDEDESFREINVRKQLNFQMTSDKNCKDETTAVLRSNYGSHGTNGSLTESQKRLKQELSQQKARWQNLIQYVNKLQERRSQANLQDVLYFIKKLSSQNPSQYSSAEVMAQLPNHQINISLESQPQTRKTLKLHEMLDIDDLRNMDYSSPLVNVNGVQSKQTSLIISESPLKYHRKILDMNQYYQDSPIKGLNFDERSDLKAQLSDPFNLLKEQVLSSQAPSEKNSSIKVKDILISEELQENTHQDRQMTYMINVLTDQIMTEEIIYFYQEMLDCNINVVSMMFNQRSFVEDFLDEQDFQMESINYIPPCQAFDSLCMSNWNNYDQQKRQVIVELTDSIMEDLVFELLME